LMDYKETIDYLYNLRYSGSKLELGSVRELVGKMGNPQNSYKTIHIAGTTGKGSVATMLASMLTAAGIRTGLFTSPHLHSYTERIRVDGKEIQPDDVIRLTSHIRNVSKNMDTRAPTFFELTTALAFQYFKEQQVKYAVVETGLGGRLDATNVVVPETCVITTLGRDHTHVLGETIGQIAWEKCGIIKPRIPVITSTRDGIGTIRQECKKKNSELIEVAEYHPIESNLEGQAFDVGAHSGLWIKALGEHQLLNAATAIAVAERLGVDETAIREGLRKVELPARFEIMQKQPFIVVDGAHNPPSIAALVNTLKDIDYGKLILVMGVMKDKEIDEMSGHIAPLAAHVVATQAAGVERAMPAAELLGILQTHNKNCELRESVAEAVDYGKSLASEQDLICVAGSIYVAAEAREHMLGLKETAWKSLAETNIAHSAQVVK
jgi:dihydrofolate synthase/folylpolyglutamate synthase